MSKGSPVLRFRLPRQILAEVDAALPSANAFRRGEPYTLSSWIVQAIKEKLAKLKRGRAPRGTRIRRADSPVRVEADIVVEGEVIGTYLADVEPRSEA